MSGTARVPHRRFITAALMLIMVLASMEATVSSTAMPTIIGDLHGLEHYAWVASIYLLTSTISMPFYGRLADVWGRKRVLMLAIGVFAAGSLLAALTGYVFRSMPALIVFRGIQGLGAGGIMPVVLTIIGDIFTIEERAKIQGLFSAVWGTASLAGPALGALLVHTLGWPSIFWINLPAGFLGLVVLIAYYHDNQKPHSLDLDLPGISFLALTSVCLLTSLSLATELPWWATAGTLALSAILGVIFIRIERRAINPIMPLDLMRHPAIGPAVIASGFLGLGVFAIDTYVPLYVQGGRGGDAAAAAATVTPVMLAWASSGVVAAPLIVRWGFRKTATLGAIISLIGYCGVLVCAILALPLPVLTAVLFLCGAGFGPMSMSMLISAQDAASWQQRGLVTSSVTFFRHFGGALGVGMLGSLFNLLLMPGLAKMHDNHVTPADLLNPHQLQKLSPEVLKPAQAAISNALIWVLAAMVLSGVLQLWLSTRLSVNRHKGKVRASEAIGESVAPENTTDTESQLV